MTFPHHIPPQSGHAGKALTTDGAKVSWGTAAGLGRLLYQSPVTDFPWTGPGEQAAKSYVLPGGTFGTAGQVLRIRCLWQSNTDSNLKQVRLYLGARVLRLGNLANIRQLDLETFLVYCGVGVSMECINVFGSQHANSYLDPGYLGTAVMTAFHWVADLDFTVNQTLQMTVTQPGSIGRWMRVELLPAAP